MKNSNWIFLTQMLIFIIEVVLWYFGESTLYLALIYMALFCTYFIVKELEKLNETKSVKKSDELFAKKFAYFIKYKSDFPEHKDKSIEELLQIYKKSI